MWPKMLSVYVYRNSYYWNILSRAMVYFSVVRYLKWNRLTRNCTECKSILIFTPHWSDMQMEYCKLFNMLACRSHYLFYWKFLLFPLARKCGKTSKMDALIFYYLLSASLAGLCMFLRIWRRRKRRKTRCHWVCPWLKWRDNMTHQTMNALYQELLLVGIEKFIVVLLFW